MQKHKHRSLREFWRDLHRDQLLGFYSSIAIRMTAGSIVGVFVPFYLYELGFSLQAIMGYYAFFGLFRVFANIGAAYVIARFGPKHAIAASIFSSIIHLSLLFSLESQQWPLVLLSLVYAINNALFFTSYHVIFSKIKVRGRSGREIGYMLIVRRMGSMIGPLIGGLLANSYGLQTSLVAASVLMLLSLAPLFLTKEPVRTHQHVKFKGLYTKLSPRLRDIVAMSFINLGGFVSAMLWTLYISLTIFVDNTYASIGVLSTFAVMISMLTASLVGRLSDRHGARQLMRLGIVLEVLTALVRPFIGSAVSATGHNVVRAQLEAPKSIPVTKGYYAQADDFPGQRIIYIAITESILIGIRGSFYLALILLMGIFDPLDVLLYGSVAASILGLIGFIERYRALD